MSTFDVSSLKVWIDGEIVAGREATVSIFDHGLLYGDGVFEGIRVFSGAVFRLPDHLDRLERSCRAVAIELPWSRAELVDAVLATVRESRLDDAHVRLIVTRGFGQPGIDPRRCERPTVIVTAYPFPPLLGSDPIRLVTTHIVRKAPLSVGAHVKSLNYLDSVLAKQHATAAGADDGIMLDGAGAVAECSGANVFAVVGERLVTPTTRAALPGITRRTVLELAAELGIASEEREIFPMELYVADAVFLTGSGAGLVAVREIDGRPVATAGHPLYARLAEGYRGRTADERYRTPVG